MELDQNRFVDNYLFVHNYLVVLISIQLVDVVGDSLWDEVSILGLATAHPDIRVVLLWRSLGGVHVPLGVLLLSYPVYQVDLVLLLLLRPVH